MIEYQRALYNLNSPRMITSDRGRTWAPFQASGIRYDSMALCPLTITSFSSFEMEVVSGVVDKAELLMCILQRLGLAFTPGRLHLEMGTIYGT